MPADMDTQRDIDQFDRRILDALAEDGRMSITDLARRVGLSNTPCQQRLKRLLAEGKLDPTRYKDVLMHRIDGGEVLEGFAASTKSGTDAKLIHRLRDLGQECARKWLGKKFSALGVACSVNIAHDYLDDLRVPSR